MNPVRKGLAKRPEDWRWSSYNSFPLDKITVAACPIQIGYMQLTHGHLASVRPTVRTALTVPTRYFRY
jgi:hypothetical protein